MKKLSKLEKIFSITNNPGHKIIRFLGVPITIDSRKIFNTKYGLLPIDNNKIVFCNFKGGGFGCNSKYIAEKIIEKHLPYKLVWLVNKRSNYINTDNMPDCIKIVDFKSPKALYELATAKIWIDNQRKLYHIRKGLQKRDNQYYIQTWHGSLGIKKVGMDSKLTEVINDWVPFGIEDAQMIDYLISNSKFETDIYKKNFWGHGEILELGHPRNDIFFKNTEHIKEKLYKELEIDKDKKILLYVPSFRDDYKLYCYGLEYTELLETVKEKFGGDWVILVRMHPNLLKYSQQLIPMKDFIINVSEYPDIQELLVSADIAITDYSSCIFDFILSKKPAFIYATDQKDFDTNRGLYYPLSETPFPIAENNEELRQNIKDFDINSYQRKVQQFLNDKGCIEKGNASENVVSLIEKIMK